METEIEYPPHTLVRGDTRATGTTIGIRCGFYDTGSMLEHCSYIYRNNVATVCCQRSVEVTMDSYTCQTLTCSIAPSPQTASLTP